MLKRCRDKKDMTEWNEWREKNPDEEIWLEGKDFSHFWLRKANFMKGSILKESTGTYTSYADVHLKGSVFEWSDLRNAVFAGSKMDNTKFWSAESQNADFQKTHLVDAKLEVAHFEECNFNDAILKNARLNRSCLNGTKFMNSNLKGCQVRASVVDGATIFWDCKINRYSKTERFTDFTGIPLDNVIIDPGTKQLLEYNIRRMNWEEWYKKGYWWQQILKRLFIWPFWLISDYGLRTWRVIATFFGLSIAFAVVYWLCPTFVMVNQVVGDIRGFWHALYFSVVTMTTLGFGDIAANPDSWVGQTLLMLQVILGYVLLGALVTRFAVLFTAGGPAGKFADEKKNRNKTTEKIKN
ncbi:MAG: pentapeptide repeat-containing protein [Planctomycetota bacterium]